MANANYNLLVGIDILKGDAQKKIDQLSKNLSPIKLKVDVEGADQAAKGIQNINESANSAAQSVDDLNLTFNVANQMFQQSIDIISGLVSQVKELDASLTEYKKVSDLSGSALDDYVDKLTTMGQSVARTGKPNRSEPGRWDGKPASRTAPKPLKASRALQLQYGMRQAYMNVGNYYNCKDNIWSKDLSIVKKGRLGAKP